MKCPEKGAIRAFIDGELAPQESARLQSHLEACPACRENERIIRSIAGVVDAQFSSMLPGPGEAMKSGNEAFLTFKQRVRSSESAGERLKRRFETMFKPFSGQRWRSVTLVSVLVMAMALVFFTPMGIAAENFLSVFRVKKIQTVSLDSTNIPNMPSPADLGVFEMSAKPTVHSVPSVADAASAVGFSVALPSPLPAGFTTAPEIQVTDPTSFKFTFDLPKIEAYLAAAGIRGMDLPASLNGATVKADFPASVALTFRDGKKSINMGMTKSPTLEVPSDIDVDLLRNQLLKFPGLSRETQAQLASIQDWKNTIVVPVARGGASRDVSINGAQGVLVSGAGQNPFVSVLWLKNDLIYGLSGNLGEDEILNMAKSIQ